ncbi:unnamed protein product [Effrenium voratum]|nr:unnamed protein product [Effrenium voratum]
MTCLASSRAAQRPYTLHATSLDFRFRAARVSAFRWTARRAEIESPFKDGVQQGKPKLPLTLENVEEVLDELRPYLQNDGGDCKLLEIEGPILRLEMQGSCASCSSSAITVKMGIERTMLDRFPEIYEVEAVMPGFKIPTEEGIEEVLSSIAPFLSVSGGTIELLELDDGDGVNPRPTIVLGIGGPPAKNTSLKAEVLRRMKSVYGQAEIQMLEMALEEE